MNPMRKLFFFLLFVTVLFTSCDEFYGLFGGGFNGESEKQPVLKGDTVSRTLLVYIMAENSISKDLSDDFGEIKNAAYDLPEDVRLFVYFDNSDTTRLPMLYQYYPYKNSLVENVVYSFDEDVCSSDTAVLGKVLDVIFDDYPTKAFDLIMGSHADGWVRHHSKTAPNRIIGIDNGKNTTSNKITTTIEIEELAALLERLPVKVDRLMFDACLMQGVEVAYAMRNSANWIIGSPAEIPSFGAPYDKVVPMFFNPVSTVKDIMYEYKKAYDNEYYGVVLAAVSAASMQEFADSTRRYVEKSFRINAHNENKYGTCLAYVPRKHPTYYDVNSVMKCILDSVDYSSWKAVFDKAVPYAMISNSRNVYSGISGSVVKIGDDCGAVSAYFPVNDYTNQNLIKDFRTTEWYKAAGWENAGW